MRSVVARVLVSVFAFTSFLAELPPAQAAGPAFTYSAYRRPNDRIWNKAWTADLLAAIRAQRPRLAAARDVETFCPGYGAASEEQKNNCFVRLLTGISAWESSNTPALLGDQGRSVGLLQLGVFNCRREKYTAADLKTAKKNLACGARLAGDLIARDGVISNEVSVNGRWGTTRVQRRGLGRGGWSVMMKNVTVTIRGRPIQVGRLQQIAGGMMSYRDSRTGTLAVLSGRRKPVA